MDRHTFLSCQTFLCPLSERWLVGSVLDTSSSQRTTCRSEVLLSNHRLSIEATCEDDDDDGNDEKNKDTLDDEDNSNSNNEDVSKRSPFHRLKSLGPCYFVRRPAETEESSPSDDFDSAMSKIELTLHTWDLLSDEAPVMTTPGKDSVRQERSLFGGRTHPSEMMDDSLVADKKVVVLVANIDGRLFQLDLTGVQRMQSMPSKEKGEGGCDQTDLARGDEKPACLVLQSPWCLFRIFPFPADISDTPPIVRFDAVQSMLESLMTPTCHLPFPLSSYCGDNASFTDPPPGDVQQQQGADTDCIGCDSLDQRLQSHSKSWKALALLERVLCTPVSPGGGHVGGSSSGATGENLKLHLAELFTTIPAQVSTSYVGDAERSKAVEIYDRNICKQHDEIDDTFQGFWFPGKERPNKRRRSAGRGTGGERKDVQQISIRRMRDVLKKHKELLEAKYQLTRLPMRG